MKKLERKGQKGAEHDGKREDKKKVYYSETIKVGVQHETNIMLFFLIHRLIFTYNNTSGSKVNIQL